MSALVFGLGVLLDSSSIPSIKTNGSEKMKSTIPVPDFSLQTLNGQSRKISEFRGKVIILNFWASWCGPCKEEFPEMLDIVNRNQGIVLLAISNDDNNKDIQRFLKEMEKAKTPLKGENVFLAHDPLKEISSTHFNVLRLPETFIINKDLQIVEKVIGSEKWLNKEMAKRLQDLL